MDTVGASVVGTTMRGARVIRTFRTGMIEGVPVSRSHVEQVIDEIDANLARDPAFYDPPLAPFDVSVYDAWKPRIKKPKPPRDKPVLPEIVPYIIAEPMTVTAKGYVAGRNPPKPRPPALSVDRKRHRYR